MPAPLLRLFEGSRVMRCAGERLEVLPDGRTRLVFRTVPTRGVADVWVSGPRTRAHVKREPGVQMLVVPFKPGWASPVLGIAASALKDRVVRLDELWGEAAQVLCEALRSARSDTEALQRIAECCAQRSHLFEESASARLARQAARLLEGEEVRVTRVAARLGVTARHLRRTFVEHVGLRPKDFARVARLRRALGLAGASDWGAIAAAAGYYDQAHLAADFREMLGTTPSEYLARRSASSS